MLNLCTLYPPLSTLQSVCKQELLLPNRDPGIRVSGYPGILAFMKPIFKVFENFQKILSDQLTNLDIGTHVTGSLKLKKYVRWVIGKLFVWKWEVALVDDFNVIGLMNWILLARDLDLQRLRSNWTAWLKQCMNFS